MLSRILPKQADNAFHGHWLAIWLLVPSVLMRAVIGANSILMARDTAMNADGIPLNTYDPAGANAVVTLFALGGLSFILLAVIGTVVLLRYRALIPFAYLLLLLDGLGSKAIVLLHPIARAGATKVGAISVGTLINYTLLAILVLGFLLSLTGRAKETEQTNLSERRAP